MQCGDLELFDLVVNKDCFRLYVCAIALCQRLCSSCQTFGLMAAVLYRRRHCLVAMSGSTRPEESRKIVETSWMVHRSSQRASMIVNVQVMLVVDSSADKARAHCLLSSVNILRVFALALHLSYRRAESRLCMRTAGGSCPDHTEDPQMCCSIFP